MLWSGAETEDVYPNIYNHSAVIGRYYSNTTAYCVSSYFNWVLYFDLRAA
jgi:predicted LPLAT superfamily acyltransferase